MKLTRILSLMIVGVFFVLALASCGATAPEITVTLRIIADDPENPILDTPVKIQSENPTVLEAFQEGCIVNEISYTLTEAGDSVKDIADYKDYTDENGLVHYWMYYINDVEPSSGKANVNTIADGDVILYEYVTFEPEVTGGEEETDDTSAAE